MPSIDFDLLKRYKSSFLSWLLSIKAIILVLLLSFLQENLIIAQNTILQQFTTDDGLPHSTCYQLFQDKKGYLWIGTEFGLTQFDGNQFKVYNSPLITENTILRVYGDEKDRIWFINLSQQLYYLSQKEVFQFDPEELRSQQIKCVFYKDNLLWVGTKDGLFLFQEVNNTFQFIKRHLVGNLILKFEETIDGIQVIARIPTQQNVQTRNIIDQKISAAIDSIPCFVSSQYHNITQQNIKDEYSIFVLDAACEYHFPATIQGTPASNPPISDQFVVLKHGKFHMSFQKNSAGPATRDKDGNFYFISDNYLVGYNTKGEKIKKLFLNLGPIKIHYLLLDREGNFWLSTMDRGLLLLTNEALSFTDLPSKNIIDIEEDKFGNLYFGASPHWVYKYSASQRKMTSFQSSSTRTNNIFYDLSKTANDDIFAISNDHVDLITPIHPDLSTISEIPLFKIDSTGKINRTIPLKSIYLDRKNNLWFSTQDILRKIVYDPKIESEQSKKIMYLDHPGNKMLKKRIYKIFESSKGIIYIGSTTGLYSWNEGQSPLNYTSDSLNLNEYVTEITEDSHQNIWIGTQQNGIFCINDTSFVNYSVKEGLSSNYVRDVFIDSKDNVWIASNKGITKMEYAKGNYPSYRHFTKKNGLVSNNVNAVHIKGNEVWAGTENGITVLRDNQKDNNTLPYIYLDKINDHSIFKDSLWRFSYDDNAIEIYYSGVYFSQDLKYFYKIKETDKNWSSTTQNSVRFPALPPGKYTFLVKVCTQQNLCNEAAQILQFEISPPLADRLWFRLSIIALLIGIVWLTYRWRVNNIRKRYKEKKIIQQRFVELELQALQAQMNPHFIFNALTSIQNRIRKQDAKGAENYLAKFARMMRLFLEASKNKYITIEREIQLIKYYIELENLRFQNRFETNILIEEKVNTSLKIPSLLLQPFVENAINHGLLNLKDKKGILQIQINQPNDDETHIIIEDNGVGREKADLLKKNSILNYQSRGTQITNERLEVIQQMTGKQIDVIIDDLYHPSNNAALGTKVTLIISHAEEYDQNYHS